jgi:DNA-binding ferritin-like protein
MKEEMEGLIVKTKIFELWFLGAHHCTKGKSFVGDHAILYSEIYEKAGEYYDSFIERAIGLTGDEMMACPICIMQKIGQESSEYLSPCNKDSDEIAAMALDMVKEYLLDIENTYNSLKDSGEITLGLDDLLMSTSSELERYVYLLGQREEVMYEHYDIKKIFD